MKLIAVKLQVITNVKDVKDEWSQEQQAHWRVYIKYILLNEFLVYDGNIFFKKKSITVKL